MDLETITINNTMVPYLLCWYEGKNSKSYFINIPEEIKDLALIPSDTLNKYISDMILDAMKDICIRKYKNYRIYLHNFSKFEVYFLIQNLAAKAARYLCVATNDS